MSGRTAWPSVSVLVPTHDREHLLPATLAAILGQDYPGDIEVLLTYDQRPPVPAHEREAPGRCVRVLANSRTPGLAGARNSALFAATGQLCALCDDDDVWHPGKLKLQVAELRRSGAQVCVSGVVVVRGGRRTPRVPPGPVLTLADLAANRVVAASPSTVVVTRESFLGDIGPVDEDIPGSYGEDWDWLLRAAAVGPIAVVPRPLVDLVWHPGSFFRTRWDTIVEALDYLLAKHEVLRASPGSRAYVYGRQAFAHAARGRRREAARLAVASLRLHPTEWRAALALAVAARVLPAGLVVRAANAAGRGI